ncbi:hypothetical protein AURDEDRAFT_173230 [Auricularia subglabra TFB-10046 SS5]|uniref:F-box domain-containing protein n=1 Tax=Auricularia subglabra (strain TFB-10046 / SS5) TaxID=717982 RepID=J0LHU1_AURST|nr:hypothetical protein AURDEDRAFT_173230 [Auricularia subglabra TFB-10046 SS5]
MSAPFFKFQGLPMTTGFLPPELYPLILAFVIRPQHLAICALVNGTMNAFATPMLYENVRVFAWQKGSKQRIMRLFETLAEHPELAKYVRRIELRDYPLLMGDQAVRIEEVCLRALENAINLQSCCWTRDGSFSDAVIRTLARLQQLRELDFNGHSGSSYNPKSLLALNQLTHVSVIMPDRETGMLLSTWLELLAPQLRTLSLICKSSGIITDDMLRRVAPQLSALEQLHLTGCTRITAACVSEILSASEPGIASLRLEGLHFAFDLKHLSSSPRALRSLQSLTITFIAYHESEVLSLPAVQALLLHTPRLAELNLHPPPPATRARLPESFISELVRLHGVRLRKLAINRVILGVDELGLVCGGMPRLQQLYITLLEADMSAIAKELRRLPYLHAVHLSFPFALDAAGILGMSNDDPDSDSSEHEVEQQGYERAYIDIAKACPSLSEFGVQNRVWQVERVCTRDEAGSWTTEIRLGRRENPAVAEQFLVMRI